jgi:hypothetical protein
LANAVGVSLYQINRLIGVEAPIEVDAHEVPASLNTYESLVQATGGLGVVERSAIHGLLQTKAYATAIESYGPLPLTEEQVMERIDLRLARQSVLSREPDPLRLTVLMAETVLLDRVGDDDVMREQIDYLTEAVKRPNIDLRLLPADGRAAFARGGFELLTRTGDDRPFMVVTADVGGINYEDGSHKIAPFLTTFSWLDNAALSTFDSIRRLKIIRETYR